MKPDSTSPPIVTAEVNAAVGTVVLRRPPHNYFDLEVLTALADAVEALCGRSDCRAIVLASEGRSFCAGAYFSSPASGMVSAPDPRPLYTQGLRLFSASKPIVAAVQGAAIGGGLGLALVADFRVACPEARFTANFARLGFHCGFGISHTLPRLIGMQQASRLLLTGCDVGGAQALQLGLADLLVVQSDVLAQAQALAHELAANAPLAVTSMRATLRRGLLADIEAALAHETHEQFAHFGTADFREGIQAASARRAPSFEGL